MGHEIAFFAIAFVVAFPLVYTYLRAKQEPEWEERWNELPLAFLIWVAYRERVTKRNLERSEDIAPGARTRVCAAALGSSRSGADGDRAPNR